MSTNIFNIPDKDFPATLSTRIQLFDDVVSIEAQEDEADGRGPQMRPGSLIYITRKEFDKVVDAVIQQRFKEFFGKDSL